MTFFEKLHQRLVRKFCYEKDAPSSLCPRHLPVLLLYMCLLRTAQMTAWRERGPPRPDAAFLLSSARFPRPAQHQVGWGGRRDMWEVDIFLRGWWAPKQRYKESEYWINIHLVARNTTPDERWCCSVSAGQGWTRNQVMRATAPRPRIHRGPTNLRSLMGIGLWSFSCHFGNIEIISVKAQRQLTWEDFAQLHYWAHLQPPDVYLV